MKDRGGRFDPPPPNRCRVNISNLGEYHNLYVKLDTALIADIFENFRDKHIETDKLDPAYFSTTPGLP